MHKYRKAAINIAFLTIILTSGTYSGLAKLTNNSENDKDQSRQEAILETFENDDFTEWKRIVGQKEEITHLVDENDFHVFVAARKIARAGNYDQAIKLTKKLEQKLKEKIGDILV
jgi:hypothetical protein